MTTTEERPKTTWRSQIGRGLLAGLTMPIVLPVVIVCFVSGFIAKVAMESFKAGIRFCRWVWELALLP